MDINLYFCKWDSYYSNAIRLVTGDEWSHVGIGYKDKNGNHQVWQAINKGFVYVKDANYFEDKKYVEIVTINVNNLNIEDFKKVVSKQVGKGYDWISIFNLFTMLIFNKPLLNIKGNRLLICSEAVARVLKQLLIVDLSKELNKDEDYITPQEIYDFFSEEEK